MSRRTAPSLWWSTWKPRRSEGDREGGRGVRRHRLRRRRRTGERGRAEGDDGLRRGRQAGRGRGGTWVRRYLMLSSIGAGDPEGGSEAMRPYLRAKSRADERLKSSSLDYTIILHRQPDRG